MTVNEWLIQEYQKKGRGVFQSTNVPMDSLEGLLAERDQLKEELMNQDGYAYWKGQAEEARKAREILQEAQLKLIAENLQMLEALKCDCDNLSRGFDIHSCVKCNTLNDAPLTVQFSKRIELMKKLVHEVRTLDISRYANEIISELDKHESEK